MFSEYGLLVSKNLGFDLLTAQDIVIGIVAVLGLAAGGFALKGVWGAIWALALGLLGYMFWNQISLF